MRLRFRSFLFLGWLFCTATLSRADNGWDGHILSLKEENDAFGGTDRHYTQGGRISYLSKDDTLPHWLDRFSNWLPALGYEVQAKKYGLAMSQEIYTPENLQTPNLVTDDRPYAGWLYSTATLQRRGPMASGLPVMETLKVDVGVIGPQSLAEEAQKMAHSADPQGWDNQLKTEPGINLRYERSFLFAFRNKEMPWGADIIPFLQASGGNVYCYLGAGSTLRFGYNIPNEFEAAHEQGPLKWGAYLFTTAQGRCVLRNIFLDGNTFRESHSVEKEHLVGDVRVGLTIVLKCIELTAAQTFLSQEFKSQRSHDSYGTATITVKF